MFFLFSVRLIQFKVEIFYAVDFYFKLFVDLLLMNEIIPKFTI